MKIFILDFTVRECYYINVKVFSINDISKAIKERRKSLNLTQLECASMCNVGLRFFSELENGKESLHIGKVLNCISILGINIHLINREDDR